MWFFGLLLDDTEIGAERDFFKVEFSSTTKKLQIKEGFSMTQSYNQAVKNISGSFAVEGIDLSKQSLHNLERLSKGNVSITELVKEISERYKIKGK